jgi:hypothetical protein
MVGQKKIARLLIKIDVATVEYLQLSLSLSPYLSVHTFIVNKKRRNCATILIISKCF